MANQPKYMFWIKGNRRQCQKTWDSICQKVLEKTNQEPNVEVLHCGFNPSNAKHAMYANAADVYRILRTKDVFDKRPRIIKMIGLPEGYAGLSEYLQYVGPDNMLVVWGDFGYRVPGSKRFVSAKTSKFYKTIKSKGMILESPTEASSDSHASCWAAEVAQDYEKTIEVDASKKLVSFQGRNLDLLANAIGKLATYQSGKVIKVEDVVACCSGSVLDEVWHYLECLDHRRYDGAIEYLHRFYETAGGAVGDSFYGEISKFFGALYQHFFFLMILKDVCGNSLDAKVMEKSLQDWKKVTPSQLADLSNGKITVEQLSLRFSSGYIYNNMKSPSIQAAFQWRKAEIYKAFADVLDCIFLCRQHSTDRSYIKLCLDVFTMAICKKITHQQASVARGHKRKYLV